MENKQETKNKLLNLLKTISPQKIIAVTKNQPITAAQTAIKNKIFKIGENKIQEAEKKYNSFKERGKIELHYIGHLQTNKAKKATRLFDVIQTIDTIRLAEKINKEAKKIKKRQSIYVQINISEDPQKKGIQKNKTKQFCEKIEQFKNLKLHGIMVILKKDLEEKQIRRFYRETKLLQKEIKKRHPACKEVSMGMSNDFLIALEEGATQVRLGRAIYGEQK